MSTLLISSSAKTTVGSQECRLNWFIETPVGQSGLVNWKDSPVKSTLCCEGTPARKKKKKGEVTWCTQRFKMERSAQGAENQGPCWAGSTTCSKLPLPWCPCMVLDPLILRTILACQKHFRRCPSESWKPPAHNPPPNPTATLCARLSII